MRFKQRWQRFVDRTARKPTGPWAIRNYNKPRAHYWSFKVIMEHLDLHENDIYCEIGCGGGVLLNMAMTRAKEGLAIDHSPDMVALAEEKNRQAIAEGRLEIVQGRAEQLPWPSDSVTACASANMFFFVEQPTDMLREVLRILAPGGRFSMVTMNNRFWGRMTFGRLYALKLYSDIEMASLLINAGFTNVMVKKRMGLLQVCYGEKSD